MRELIEKLPGLTLEELRSLNSSVVDMMKAKKAQYAVVKKSTLYVGQTVSVNDRKSVGHTFEIIKINRSRVQCKDKASGQVWSVPISMIE